jgi:hypothetical protein
MVRLGAGRAVATTNVCRRWATAHLAAAALPGAAAERTCRQAVRTWDPCVPDRVEGADVMSEVAHADPGLAHRLSDRRPAPNAKSPPPFDRRVPIGPGQKQPGIGSQPVDVGQRFRRTGPSLAGATVIVLDPS